MNFISRILGIIFVSSSMVSPAMSSDLEEAPINGDGQRLLAVTEMAPSDFIQNQELIGKFVTSTVEPGCLSPGAPFPISLDEAKTCLGLDTEEGYDLFVQEHGSLEALMQSGKFSKVFHKHYVTESQFVANAPWYTSEWVADGKGDRTYRGDVLQVYPQVLGEKTRLKELRIAIGLTALPISASKLINLTRVNLSGNQSLVTFPLAILSLVNLQYLDLSHCRPASIPEGIGRLQNLKELNLQSTGLTELPQEMSQLTQLTFLNMVGNNLQRVCPVIYDLGSLEQLQMENNSITELADDLCKLSRLKTLCLVQNKLGSLPWSIGKLLHLEELNAKSNSIVEIPPSFFQMPAVTRVDLSINKLTTLPDTDGLMPRLTDLNLCCNQLIALPAGIGTQMPALLNLNLMGNKLTTIPVSVGKLRKITDLDLSSNALEVLPEEIGGMQNLVNFSLVGNKLQTLPRAIGLCRSLERLSLSRNPLVTLPVEMTNLKWYVTYSGEPVYRDRGYKHVLVTPVLDEHPDMKLPPQFKTWFKDDEWFSKHGTYRREPDTCTLM